MTSLDAIQGTTVVKYSNTTADTTVADALTARTDVLAMTQRAENAVLHPVDTGAWPHALRAALAARIARHSELTELAAHYASLIDNGAFSLVADPSNDGSELRLAHVVAFVDSVTVQPRDIINADIQRLQERGVSDADIVRLTELIAFMAYQVRLVAGLTLLARSQT